ncbi:dash complex subunit spc34 [Phlyctema vagabunda]|uniref:DASH complex subunit SPC34 n=1 Tax=Phlyctema vagabunda TaxID=108571 RepID=A0ABR4P8L7_9HELO
MSLLSKHLEQISLSSHTIATLPRRQTVFNVASGEVVPSNGASARAPRRNTAVAAVLGGELHSEIRRNEQGRGEFDVEVLLRGAEKLNEVYPTSGVMEKIYSIRTRHAQLSTSLDHYETKVARQTRELERMNRGMEVDSDEDELDEPPVEDEESVIVTDEDLRVEEDEIRELERRKRELEARIRGMEMDLGGLLR